MGWGATWAPGAGALWAAAEPFGAGAGAGAAHTARSGGSQAAV